MRRPAVKAIGASEGLARGISAVIFDIDGLMLDTEPLYKDAWQQASTELGYELDDTYLKLVVVLRRTARRN